MSAKEKQDVIFYETTHKYYLQGRELISVSKVLELSGIADFSKIKWEVLERARLIGDYVHQIAELHGIGTLDENTVDSDLKGYLEAVKKFYAENVSTVIDIELPLGCPEFGYAGTPDIVYLNKKGSVCLDDFKTPADIHPSHRLQTAAYKYAWDKLNKPRFVSSRATILLRPDGTYHRIPHRDGSDLPNFMACLKVAFFKITERLA